MAPLFWMTFVRRRMVAESNNISGITATATAQLDSAMTTAQLDTAMACFAPTVSREIA